MFHRLQELIGTEVFGAEGRLGRVVDLFFEERSWSIEFLAVADDDRDQRFVSTWEITDDDRDGHKITVTLGRSELASDLNSPTKGAHIPLHSFKGILGRSVEVDGRAFGTVEDLVLTDEDWVIDSILIRRESGDQSAQHVFDIARIEQFRADGVIEMADHDPINFDTPANKWPYQLREESLARDPKVS